MRSAPSRPGSPTRRGFTLVEIMVVVVIIGLLASLAVPAFQRVIHASENSRTVNDFRIFAQAFETYATENGNWPPTAGAGVIPTGMSSNFRNVTWVSTPVIGGRWTWDNATASGGIAGISIQNWTATDAQLAEIDAKLDDGDLTMGRLRKTTATKFTLILEEP